MKKIIILSIILFSCLILFEGCRKQNNEYDNYEYYDLNDNEINTYTFYHDDGNYTYAVADITKSNDESGTNGIFYKIQDNKYILLDTILTCENASNIHLYKEYTYFYQDNEENDKLYINRCLGKYLIEYTFDKENIKSNELKFDLPKVSENSLEYVEINTIEKVDRDYIYFKVDIANTYQRDIMMKCSLTNKKCEIENK